jgi:hypothetical protein
MNSIMNKLFVCLLIVLLFWNISDGFRVFGVDDSENQIDSDDSLSDQLENDEDQVNNKEKLTQNCLLTILGPSLPCIMVGMKQWHITPFDLKSRINHKPTCCGIWQMTDCMTKNAKIRCSAEEYEEFETHMNGLTEKRNSINCTLFPYNSKSCSTEQQEEANENPVFTNVLFRENGHVVKEPGQQNDQGQNDQGQEDKESPISLDELKLSQRLLDRIHRITINQMVIDLHPIKQKEVATKLEIDREDYLPQ